MAKNSEKSIKKVRDVLVIKNFRRIFAGLYGGNSASDEGGNRKNARSKSPARVNKLTT